MRLFNKQITIFRDLSDSGYYDENEKWVDGVSSTPVRIVGSIQPYGKGHTKNELPDGVRTDDVVILRSKSKLVTQDDLLKTTPDEMEYLGATYQCFTADKWSQGLRSDHYMGIFIRKDKL